MSAGLLAPLAYTEEEGEMNHSTESKVRLLSSMDYLDDLAREPMILVHPDGYLFIAGFGSQVTGTDWTRPPPIWRSGDQGDTWERLDVGSSAQGAQGNSDVDLAVGPDGEIYFVALGFNRETREGTQVAMGVSTDLGDTWNWQFLSQTRFDDRPWVGVGTEGIAHAIWNDGSGVCHAVSRDGGENWHEQERVAPAGGSSHLAIGPAGRVAVRVIPFSASANRYDAGVDAIALSLDHGLNWMRRPVPEGIEWHPEFAAPGTLVRWVEPLAWTADGRLHYAWSSGDSMHYSHSADEGRNWTTELIAEGQGMAFFPYMVSNGENRLAVSWFVSDGAELFARLAVVDLDKPIGEGRISIAEPLEVQSWIEDLENKVQTTAGEYLAMAFLPDGDIALVAPIQDIHRDRWGFSFRRFRYLAE